MTAIQTSLDKYKRDGLASFLTSSVAYARARTKSAYLSAIDGTVTCHGVELNLNNNDIDIRTKRGFFHESFEAPELDLIDQFIDEGDVIELGAGVGFISCYLNKRISDHATHISVEANPHLIPTLRTNRRVNKSTFEIEHAAYSPSGSTVDFHLQNQYPSGSVRDERRGKSSIEVDATTIKRIAEIHDINDFTLLADIEGEEIGLIRSELSYLERHCRRIIVEFHSFVPKDEYEQALATLNSSAFEVEACRSKRNDEYDDYRVYKNTNIE